MPDLSDSGYVLLLVPAGVAIACATVIGIWLRKRVHDKRKPPAT